MSSEHDTANQPTEVSMAARKYLKRIDDSDWQVERDAGLFRHNPSGFVFAVKWVLKPELSSDEATVSQPEATTIVSPPDHGMSRMALLELSGRAVGLFLEGVRKESPRRKRVRGGL
jgi:hypothetical protein